MMPILPNTSKLHLKKDDLKKKFVEAGESKGHFYLFTLTLNGLPQMETIWICTHIQWT